MPAGARRVDGARQRRQQRQRGDQDSSETAITPDGRFIAFSSYATNLVAGDNNAALDIFVHDRQTGVTERVNLASDGSETIIGNSIAPSISADGRFVAFSTVANNLVAGDANGDIDIFVRDRQTGTTERVSVDGGGGQATDQSYAPFMSVDGRYVVFASDAENLVAGDSNASEDVFVHDRQTGITRRVSIDSAGGQSDGYSTFASISADGRFVAFYSNSTNLVPGDTNANTDVFVHDRLAMTTKRVSIDSIGTESSDDSYGPAISADGRFVAFYSYATDLVAGDTNAHTDIFVRDQGLLPDANDDLAIDFGGAGLWARYSDGAWAKLHNASPVHIAIADLDGNGRDELIADYGAAGIWARTNNTSWQKLHNGTSEGLARRPRP